MSASAASRPTVPPEPTPGSLDLAERFAVAALLSLVAELLADAEPLPSHAGASRVQTRQLVLLRRASDEVHEAQAQRAAVEYR